MANIKDHPNALLRREIEALQLRVKILEQQSEHSTRAVLALSETIQSQNEMMLRIARLISAIPTRSPFHPNDDDNGPPPRSGAV